MTPDQFERLQRSRLEALAANRERDCLRITNDLLGQIRLRVQTTGENYLEQSFAPYTEQYANRRAKLGYQTGYVDFTRTGRAWASVRPETIDRTDRSVTVQVASRTAQDRVKFQGAVRKRGNLLLPSKSEIDIAQEANRARILQYIVRIVVIFAYFC